MVRWNFTELNSEILLEIRHAKKYGKFYHLGAFCGLSAFGYFTFKYVEENQEESHFAKRYPDPSLSTEVQQILIPKMMDTIARERICKRQYMDFDNCVNDHGDMNRFNNKEEGWLKKFLEFTELPEFLEFFEFREVHEFREFLEFADF